MPETHNISYVFFDIETDIDRKSVSLADKGCLYEGKRILLFSTTFKTELEKFAGKDYKPTSAKVTAIVYWKKTKSSEENRDNENIGKEVKIILPIICLKR